MAEFWLCTSVLYSICIIFPKQKSYLRHGCAMNFHYLSLILLLSTRFWIILYCCLVFLTLGFYSSFCLKFHVKEFFSLVYCYTKCLYYLFIYFDLCNACVILQNDAEKLCKKIDDSLKPTFMQCVNSRGATNSFKILSENSGTAGGTSDFYDVDIPMGKKVWVLSGLYHYFSFSIYFVDSFWNLYHIFHILNLMIHWVI